MSKPSIPRGTRDFSAEEMLRREYIFGTIRDVFRLYGYQPIETPAMENLSTLLGKYGEEGDKLLFRILNSGDYFSGITDEQLLERDTAALSAILCDKGLRYDLTVPFARYVVQHRDEIVFPFRRFQIQPVWRADRPQKGRYREFFQCDVDVIGSDSLLNEYELIRIIDEIFRRLRVNVLIKLNNRKILSGIAEYIGNASKFPEITVAIDKLEKIGIEQVNNELREKGLSDDSVSKLQPVLQLQGDTGSKLDELKKILSASETGIKGILEMTELFTYIQDNVACDVELDLSLARGLNYYTGAIIEVKAKDLSFGSICGGGRYDNLTGVFGMPGVSGVGVSFGADRIYDVLQQLNLFDSGSTVSTECMVVNFGTAELQYAIKITDILRRSGVRTELYPDMAKMKKQLSYASARKIPYIVMAGADEIKNSNITVKTMLTGAQQSIALNDLEAFVRVGIRKEKPAGGIH
ncbi:MAG TPA: histidine--tRNA ligase [Bacteroidales bacterium]|jgi:histidyl-tRNA synthetase|nr:histidine--tRNA ligase [Bacteroidales bacterium]